MKRIAILSSLVVAACGSSNPGGPNNENPDANPNAPDADPNAPDANPNAPDANPNAPDANMSGAKPTIFTIVMENHDYNEIISSKAGDNGATYAPYFNSLIAQGGLATAYKDTGHPSLPNYLNMVSGDNQYPGIIDLDANQYPFPVKKDNLGDQLTVANIKWRSYQESSTSDCEITTDSNGLYAPKHDGFIYFDNIQNRNGSTDFCKSISVNYSKFAADLASNQYRYMWITPNLVDDGHNGSSTTASLKASDTWLKNNLPAILASDGYKAGGIVFITWDESEGRNGDDPDLIPMLVLSPRLKSQGMKLTTSVTHSGYLATVEDLLGLPRLSTVTNTPSMMGFFN